jgi:tripeptide aminopeptidase
MITKNRLLKTFIDLVKIDSPSEEEQKISKFVAKKLLDLGGNVIFDSYGNLIATFDGAGEPVILNAHLDTVEPGRNIQPRVRQGKIVSDGTTVLGGDAKAGIAAILEAISSLKEDKKSHQPIDVVLTVEEETGLVGAIEMDYSLLRAKHGITFDGQKSVNYITTSAPGYIRVDAEIIGRAAHSGYEPEKGLSAIKIAGEIIMRLQLGRIDNETTANIGLIEGGSVRNAIPEFVALKGEIRSRNLEKLDKHAEHFQEVFQSISRKYTDAKIDLTLAKEFKPYTHSGAENIIQQAENIIKKLGLIPMREASGGGTDVNIFNNKGLQMIAVGAGYYNAHTTREFVVIDEMVQTAEFCEKLISV